MSYTISDVARNAAIKQLGADIQLMVDANVQPSSGQWLAMFKRHEEAHSRIQASRPAGSPS